MRRWLAILLLLVLPHQFTWAALGAYCQHESGAAAQHVGHHAHQHQAVDADDAAHDTGKPATGAHADCAVCHAGFASMPSAGVTVVAAAMPRVDSAARTPHLPPPPVERVERPQWPRLA